MKVFEEKEFRSLIGMRYSIQIILKSYYLRKALLLLWTSKELNKNGNFFFLSLSLMYFKIYEYNLLLIIRNIGMIDNNFVKYNVINAIIINIPEYFNIVSRMIDNISFSKWNKWWISIIVQNVLIFNYF